MPDDQDLLTIRSDQADRPRKQAHVQHRRLLANTSPAWLLPAAAASLALAIFLLDTFSPLGMAVAALYVIVVLMAANFCDQRGVLLVSLGCAALTILAFLISHGLDLESTSFARGLVSLAAIAIAATLAFQNKAAELALRKSEAHLAEAQRLSHTGSFGWNVPTGEIVWSDETYRIFENDPATKPTLDFILSRTHPEDAPELKGLLTHAARDGENWSVEHRLLLPGGAIKFVNVVAHANRDAKRGLEFIGAIMDVTAAKRAEEDLQQARSNLAHVNRVTTLGEMSASISHEVSQPIAAVVTNAGAGLRWLAADPANVDEARAALTRILKDGNRASEVIKRIRAMAKKVPPRMEQVSINEIIREVMPLTRAEAEKGRVLVTVALAEDLPPIAGDYIQLQQVILNLIVNAIDAMTGTKEGPRRLVVASERTPDNQLLVRVRDTGPGVDPEHAGRLFEAFYTTKPHGIGMGLAICRSIIEAHDGRLWIEPGEPRGTTFQFSLPIDAAGQ